MRQGRITSLFLKAGLQVNHRFATVAVFLTVVAGTQLSAATSATCHYPARR